MVTVRTNTGASLIIDDEVAREFEEFGIKRGCEPIGSDLFDRISRRQVEVRAVTVKMEEEKPVPPSDAVVLVNQASLP